MIDLKRITKLWGLSTRPRLFFLMAVATQRSTWPINMRFIY